MKGQEKLIRQNKNTCIDSFVRFRVRNTSPGELRVTLFMTSLVATDEGGDSLFKNLDDPRSVLVGGLTAVGKFAVSPVEYLDKNKNQLTALAPGQSVTVQLRGNDAGWAHVCTVDEDNTYKKTHRPRSYTFSGSLGTVDLGDNVSVRSFSMEDVPLDII